MVSLNAFPPPSCNLHIQPLKEWTKFVSVGILSSFYGNVVAVLIRFQQEKWTEVWSFTTRAVMIPYFSALMLSFISGTSMLLYLSGISGVGLLCADKNG